MSKLCIVDIDGVIADSTERFKSAEHAKQVYLDEARNVGSFIKGEETRLYWRTAFAPELVSLDTLIDGAVDALATLAERGYYVLLLTSRPESMRKATRQWLYSQGCLIDVPIICKSLAFQYTKTTIWKVGIIEMVHHLYGASELLVVDDRQDNREAVLAAYPDGGDGCVVRVYGSLKEALEKQER